MITSGLYSLLLIITLAVQAGLIASLPLPFRLFPLAMVVGIILLHERSVVLGAVWLLMTGVVLEARGLGGGLAIAGATSALVAVLLVNFVFAKRSFWALLGIAAGTSLSFVLARWSWLLLMSMITDQTIQFDHLVRQGLTMVALTVAGVFIFGMYIRRFIRWSRNKFVSKEQLYDISFPQ